jgi:hypothetical protein
MRIYSPNNVLKTRSAFLLLIILVMFASSCSGRKKKLDHRNMIPEKELVQILSDIYLADGLITHPHVNKWFPLLDSTSTYYHIIEKHGYTKATLDKTLKYYFYRNPKKLVSIYDQVLGILSEMDSRTEKALLLEQSEAENLWPGRDFYAFTDIPDDEQAGFDIILNRIGTYTITFTATVFPDDPALNPCPVLYTYNTDGSGNETRNYLKAVRYIKDGYPHTYSFKVNVTAITNLHFAGSLYASGNNPADVGRHSLIELIKISYSYVLA